MAQDDVEQVQICLYHSLAPIAKQQRVNVWDIISKINPKGTVEMF